jgi:hypothetical protein
VHGFMVDPDAVSGYARTARAVADDLGALSTRDLGTVRELAREGFGRIGDESGFSAALDDFGAALRHQVRSLGNRADALARAASRTAGDYRDQEQDATSELLDLLRDVQGARPTGK